MSPKKETKKTAKSTTTSNGKEKGFTKEEQAAMKERVKEMKAEARTKKKKADGESDVLAKIAEMSEPDRTMAKRLHTIITTTAPGLSPKTWYGMPAYAGDGKVVGIRLNDNRLVLKLPALIERFGLDEARVFAKLRGDDDVTLGRRSLHGGRTAR